MIIPCDSRACACLEQVRRLTPPQTSTRPADIQNRKKKSIKAARSGEPQKLPLQTRHADRILRSARLVERTQSTKCALFVTPPALPSPSNEGGSEKPQIGVCRKKPPVFGGGIKGGGVPFALFLGSPSWGSCHGCLCRDGGGSL